MDVLYFANSKAKLETVCELLREAYNLPAFALDSGTDWWYAGTSGCDWQLDIFRAKYWFTFHTWDDSWPVGMKYLVRLSNGVAPPDFEERLTRAFKCKVVRYVSCLEDDA